MKKRALIAIAGVGAILYFVISVWLSQPHMSAAAPQQASPKAALIPAAHNTPLGFTVMQAPQKLIIPSLNIVSTILPVGRETNNEMSLPDSLTDSGWYKDGAAPGNPGKAVIAAHTGYPNKPSQFRKLEQLLPKDTFSVTDTAGNIAEFEIIQKATYRPEEAPLTSIFGDSPTHRLALITCAGEWQPASESYTHRLVIFAVRYK